MNKSLKISFALKNTYRVNSILYSLKQIPLVKRLLPSALYGVRGLKLFANIVSGLWELASAFLGKLLYFLLMVSGPAGLYEGAPGELFLHILLLLSLIGSFMNTELFNPSRDKYYAVFLLRMDAREYSLVNYFYALIKHIAGYLPFVLFFGLKSGIALWLCLLLPFSVVGLKLFVAAVSLWDYERRGLSYNENRLSKYLWGGVGLGLIIAYALPALGLVLPAAVSAGAFLLCLPLGLLGLGKVLRFRDYRPMNQQLTAALFNQLNSASKAVKMTVEKSISADSSITSKGRGFEYLNELFIKRHRKILWSSVKKISYVLCALFAGLLLLVFVKPEISPGLNEIPMTWLPYFVFIMYAINRGSNFTQALFMNCDHSLLTYPFYKRPGYVLKLFKIRLLEIMKINALPALILGGGLSLLLWATGGTEDPLNYLVLMVSIPAMSMFFSVHYLTVYYLVQPYNAGTEMKSGVYRMIMIATYLLAFYVMRLRLPTLTFGIMTIVFCALYCALACVLVYRLAPRTFRLRL